MSGNLVLNNVVAYSLQVGLLVGLAGFIPALLRLRQPGARLAYWHILLAACLLLPLVRPWRQAVIAGTVEVTNVITAVHAETGAASHALLPAFLRLDKSEIAMLLLAAGFLMRLIWLASGFWRLRHYRRRSRPLDPAPSWGVEASLRISGDISSPVTFGWRRPVVLLPAAFPSLDRATQDAILCHEVLHVRRGDWLFMVGEELVRAVFWFHPAIWWLLGEIGLAREQEVDRQAIGITREREEYMDALLAIAGAHHHLDLAPAPLFLRKRHLKQRVVQILKETPMSKISKPRLISALAAGVAMLAAACWLATGTFPLMASPQIVSDAPGVTVDLRGATVLHRSSVPYPLAALQQKVQGVLSVEVKLDDKGEVSDAHVLSGPDELRASALQAVLQWHFTRDSAGATRTVQIAYELPKGAEIAPAQGVVGGAVGGVPAGVRGGVSSGVLGGIVGAVPTASAPPPPLPPVNQSITVTAQAPKFIGANIGDGASVRGHSIDAITVIGLPDSARDELLARLPVHVGDAFTPENIDKLTQAIKDFDEHLQQRTTTATSRDAQGNPKIDRLEIQIVAPSSPAVPTRIKVGGNVQAAMVIKKVQPVYPADAKAAGVEGVVHLAAIIATDGTMQELHVLGGPALLVQSAMDAVKQWVYRPTLLNGQPVQVETTIDVNFTLNQ